MRLKIADMNVNDTVLTALVVVSATARKTKAGKDFLTLEFFDGEDKIVGNYWDWQGKAIPANNEILNVSAQVTEYLGQKQLNVRGLAVCHDMILAEFTPTSEFDISQAYKDCYELASDIKNDALRQVCWRAFEELEDEWLKIPGAKSIHHAYVGGTLVHTASVARIAKSIASVMPQANVDLATAGALLHDVGKLMTYRIDGVTIGMTTTGILFDHLFIGAAYVHEAAGTMKLYENESTRDILDLLIHIILSHHGSQEHGAVVPPMCLEAHIVHAADMLDATQEQIRTASKNIPGMFTDKIWTLQNKPQVAPEYVYQIFGQSV